MGDISEFEKGQIVDSSVTSASLCGVSRAGLYFYSLCEIA